MPASSLQRSSILFPVVALLFFLSGFAGLVYQVLWMRELGLLFGTTVYAAATTTTAFFLGLGCGSAFFGERARLSANPLRTYGWLEIAVSISALLFFLLLESFHALYATLLDSLDLPSGGVLVFKFLLGVLILFPPAFCMGGTLPVLSRFLTRGFDHTQLGKRVPIFYGINTLGAASGALAAGFFLPRWIGMTGSYWLATGTMAAVGVIALLLSRWHRAEPEPDEADAPATKTHIPRPIIGLAFFSGFSTLALQVLWIRMFAQTLHNSVYTYATILVTFLVALAIGAWIASWLAKRYASRAHHVLVWLLLLAGLLTLVSPNVFHFFGSDRGGYLGSSEDWPAYLRLVFSATGFTIFPATVALGAVFPFLLKLAESTSGDDAGQVVGRLAAVNTAGAVVGSLAAGFILLDLFGLWSSIRLVGVSYLLLVFAFVPRAERRSIAPLTAGALLLLFLTWLDPVRLPIVFHSPVKKKETILEVKEGSDATVAVIRRDQDLRLKVNNFYVLGSSKSSDSERLQAHLPLLVHPDPKDTFLVGMGTGITAGGALEVDGVERLTVAELLPGVIDAAREHFQPHINGLFEDERVEVVAEDGRNYLAITQDSYDAIVADLFVPWRSGVGGLYTREHYERSLETLKPGGIYAQWLPLYQLTESEFASIANTMQQVFPQVTVWRGDFFPTSSIVCLVGHQDSEPLDWNEFVDRSYEHDKKLGINQNPPFKSLASHFKYYAGNLTSTDVYAEARLNTDDFPHIEFEAPIKHRDEKAGEVAWFGGPELLRFFDTLQEQTSSKTDPWLNNVPYLSRSLVDFGHLLHELKVAEKNEEEDTVRETTEQLQRIVAELSALYGMR